MSDKVLKGFWLGVLGAGLIIFAFYIRQAVVSLGQPYPFEYGEGWNLWVANWIGNGGIDHLYPAVDESPYYTGIYPPLHFMLTGVLFKIFGVSLFIGRLVTFIACLASGVFAFLIVKEVTRSKWFGLLGGILFFVPPLTRSWSLFFKGDSLALCLVLLGLYLAIRYMGSRKLLWAVIPFVLAIFTKQTFIAAPIAVGLYLLFTNRKLMLQYGCALIVGGAGLLGILQLLTNGGFIYSIIVASSAFPVRLPLAVLLIRNIVIHHWVIITLALCTVVLTIVRPKELKQISTLPVIYFLVAVFVFVLITGKVGSWYSYSMEMLSVAMILIPILAWRLSKLHYPKTIIGVIIGEKRIVMDSGYSLIQFVIPVLLIIQILNLPSFASWTPPNGYLKDSYEIVLEDINSVDGEILCEDGYLLYLSGRDALYEPSYSTNSARYRNLDLSPVIGKITRGEYGLIIQEWDIEEFYKWPYDIYLPHWMPLDQQREFTMPWARCIPEMVDAILDNYQLRRHVGRLWVYEPRPQSEDIGGIL